MNGAAVLLSAFFGALITFAILDAGWLLLVAGDLFRSRLGSVLRPEPLLGAALAFYPLYIAGLIVLVVRPALAARSIAIAALNGLVLGLTAYATFDLTNLAIIEGWTIDLALIDMSWGGFATAVAASAGAAAGLRVQSVGLPDGRAAGPE